MYGIIGKSGQSSAELILLMGGIIIIILFVGTYVLNMTNSINNELEKLLENQKEYILNKI